MIEQNLYEELLGDVLPIFRRIPRTERYAVTLGGSHGKGTADRSSDFDFRLYFDARAEGAEWDALMAELQRVIDKWRQAGVEIDGVWPRTIAEIDDELNKWLSGNGRPEPMLWTVWGYHVLTDIYNQAIVEDPCGVALAWKDRLTPYPDVIRDSIIARHCDSLQYWRNDYHYGNKVSRRDAVFLSSVTSRLTHDMMQVVYALNRHYYPGDGANLSFTGKFTVKPERFEERMAEALYPGNDSGCFERQYASMAALIDDVLELARSAGPASRGD